MKYESQKNLIMLNQHVPKIAQQKVIKAIRNGAIYIYMLIHRQYGKSHLVYKLAESQLIKKAYLEPFVAICTPTIRQGLAIYETKFRQQLAPFNPIMKEKTLHFVRPDKRTCRIEWFGADRFSDTDRGRTSQANFLDEYGSIPKGFAHQNIFPFAQVHRGFNVMTGTTSKGSNHFKWEFEDAKRKMLAGDSDYYAIKWTIEDSLKNKEITQKRYDETRKIYDNSHYRHIWLGEYLMDWHAYAQQQIYGQEVSNAYEMGRVGYFPKLDNVAVDTFWDIGVNGTAVWFMQTYGHLHRYIRFYDETHGVHLQTFFKKYIIDQRHQFNFRYHFFPHDLEARESMSKESRDQMARRMLPGTVHIFKKTRTSKPDDLIDYTRRHFERCRFDEAHCQTGLQRLASYQRKPTTGKPDKNEDSHGADAFTLAENATDFFEFDLSVKDPYIEKDPRLRPTKPIRGNKIKKWW